MSGSLIPNGKQQYLDANGNPLAGGKVYYYIPYTTTPKNTYQDINLSILNTNPIILDSAGECIAWGSGAFRQQVYDVNNNLIWDQYTYGVSPAGANFISQEEVQTATQGQTVFTLTTITYTPGINSLVVFVNGSKQLVGTNYTETSSVIVTFTSGLNAGDVVDFYASLPASTQNMSNAVTVAYDPPFTNSVATNVSAKLAQTVSVKDFGAKGDGVTDDTVAIQNALNVIASGGSLFFPNGTYIHSSALSLTVNSTSPFITLYGDSATLTYTGATTSGNDAFVIKSANNQNCSGLSISGLTFKNGWSALKIQGQGTGIFSDISITNCVFNTSSSGILWFEHCQDTIIDSNHFYNGGDNGIYYSFSRKAVISNNIVLNCQGSGGIVAGYVDTVITQADKIDIIGNTIACDGAAVNGNYQSGIEVVYCSDVLIEGNVINNDPSATTGYIIKNGILVEEHIINDVSIIGNYISQIPEEGIRVGYASGSQVSNVNISNNNLNVCRDSIYLYNTVNAQIVNNTIDFAYHTGIVCDTSCSAINVLQNTIINVNQQDPYGAYFGVLLYSPNSSACNNIFIDSQIGGTLASTNSTPTYSVDTSGVLRLYSGATLQATIPTQGITWGALATAVNAISGWTLTLTSNINNYQIIYAIRRTGTRSGTDVNQWATPSFLTTPEPENYVYVGAASCIVTGNSYQTNTLSLPSNHANDGTLFTYQSDTQYDLGKFGGSRKFVGIAPPSSGYYIEGDIVYNQNVYSGGYLGWVCVTPGNPGTWKTFGLVSA